MAYGKKPPKRKPTYRDDDDEFTGYSPLMDMVLEVCSIHLGGSNYEYDDEEYDDEDDDEEEECEPFVPKRPKLPELSIPGWLAGNEEYVDLARQLNNARHRIAIVKYENRIATDNQMRPLEKEVVQLVKQVNSYPRMVQQKRDVVAKNLRQRIRLADAVGPVAGGGRYPTELIADVERFVAEYGSLGD